MANELREFEDALLASRVAARAKKPPKDEIIPRSELEDVNKLLVQAHYIVQEWVIRANHGNDGWEEYPQVSDAGVKAVTKFRDDLDALTEQVGPGGGSKHLYSTVK